MGGWGDGGMGRQGRQGRIITLKSSVISQQSTVNIHHTQWLIFKGIVFWPDVNSWSCHLVWEG
ncbi:hypothetical protein [Nostoc linckia]|uniref:hypothetical protein n=1 Tax=Nostoc linckia TaxID=92942 RepID=UPI00117CF1D7|nr:hypothetical protein [Nostoc linckia]